MSEHRYDIRISESCVNPNPLMVERQDPDNFTRFQTRERCALEITAYVLNGHIFTLFSLELFDVPVEKAAVLFDKIINLMVLLCFSVIR